VRDSTERMAGIDLWFTAAGVKRHLTYFVSTLESFDLGRELGPRRRITTLVSTGSRKLGLELLRSQFNMSTADSVMAANVRWFGGEEDHRVARESGRPSLQFPPIGLGRGTKGNFVLEGLARPPLDRADWPVGSHPNYFFTVAVKPPYGDPD